MTILYGKPYLAALYMRESQKLHSPDAELSKDSQQDFVVLGTALSALYQLGTCHGHCRGGDHILESLAGRTNNLGSAAFLLTMNGYYDEALGLIRSIGEIANLLLLFAENPAKYGEWVQATKKARIKNFGPSAVQKLMKDKSLTPMDGTWYSELCEKAVHVTPDTIPNLHNSAGQKYVGGIEQPEGFRKCVEQLTEISASVAMISSRMIGRDDLMQRLVDDIKSINDQ